MKYSYTWLKELSKTKKTPAQLAEMLTMRAFELEEMKKEGSETQMEFSILPNRAHDVLSHIGMAREICALEGRKFSQKYSLRKADGSPLRVQIKNKNLCKRYIGAIVENIEIMPSPKWMQTRLLVCGVKPINNVVDITNHVMLETGQPLHAFDKEKTFGNIIVRTAKKSEQIKLLDEKIYKLDENDLVIADSQKALALAGVMGGLDSSVTNATDSIILESANFNAANIRKTRVRHNISTESSYRFEREIDPNMAEQGVTRAIEMFKKYGGKNVKVSAINDIYPKKVKPWQIKLDTQYADSLLGEKISTSQIRKIFENLGLNIKSLKNKLVVEIPTFRIDLKTQEDLIEEIGRIYGYENISAQAMRVLLSAPEINQMRVLEDKARDLFAGAGFSEVMNYSFYGASDAEKCNLPLAEHVEVENPMNPEQRFMRWSLLPNLLKNTVLNQKHTEAFQIFELGRKYLLENGKNIAEKTIIAGLMFNPQKAGNIFSGLKGNISEVLRKLTFEEASFGRNIGSHYIFHPTRSAEIFVKGAKVGRMGEINPIVLKKYGIKSRVAAFGIRLQDLLKFSLRLAEYRSISKYPSVTRDLSMFTPASTTFAEIVENIKKAGGELVKNIDLFDVFNESLAVRLEIGSNSKTLTSEEIDGVMEKVIKHLEGYMRIRIRK